MIARSDEYIAVLDTCVPAAMPLCDTLQRMGYTPAQAERRIRAMESAFEDARVTGYESLAAAVHCGANAIVTANARHFPPGSVKPHDIDVLTPDEFLVHQFHLNQDLLMERIGEQAQAHGRLQEGLLLPLGKHAPRFAALLRPLA